MMFRAREIRWLFGVQLFCLAWCSTPGFAVEYYQPPRTCPPDTVPTIQEFKTPKDLLLNCDHDQGSSPTCTYHALTALLTSVHKSELKRLGYDPLLENLDVLDLIDKLDGNLGSSAKPNEALWKIRKEVKAIAKNTLRLPVNYWLLRDKMVDLMQSCPAGAPPDPTLDSLKSLFATFEPALTLTKSMGATRSRRGANQILLPDFNMGIKGGFKFESEIMKEILNHFRSPEVPRLPLVLTTCFEDPCHDSWHAVLATGVTKTSCKRGGQVTETFLSVHLQNSWGGKNDGEHDLRELAKGMLFRGGILSASPCFGEQCVEGIENESQPHSTALSFYIDNAPHLAQAFIQKPANAHLINDRSLPDTALCTAVSKEKIDLVKALLELGAYVNTPCANGNTALNLASQNGNVAIAQLLLTKRNNLNHSNFFGQTALHSAAEMGSSGILNLLLANGADVNRVDDESRTPLHYMAASQGASSPERLAIVKALIAAGVNVDAPASDGWTAPMTLEKDEDPEIRSIFQNLRRPEIKKEVSRAASKNEERILRRVRDRNRWKKPLESPEQFETRMFEHFQKQRVEELHLFRKGEQLAASAELKNFVRIHAADRAELNRIREKAKSQFSHLLDLTAPGRQANANQVSNQLAKDFTQFASRLIQEESQQLELKGLKAPPFSVVAMGSVPRKEATLYSDLEIAILMDRDSEENRKYFNVLSQRVADRIHVLGEADGFHLDDHANAPNYYRFPFRYMSAQASNEYVDHALNNNLKMEHTAGSQLFVATPADFASYLRGMPNSIAKVARRNISNGPDRFYADNSPYPVANVESPVSAESQYRDEEMLRYEGYKLEHLSEIADAYTQQEESYDSYGNEGGGNYDNYYGGSDSYSASLLGDYRSAGARRSASPNLPSIPMIFRNMSLLTGDPVIYKEYEKERQRVLEEPVPSKNLNVKTVRQKIAYENLSAALKNSERKVLELLQSQDVLQFDLKNVFYRYVEKILTDVAFYHNLPHQEGVAITDSLAQRNIMHPELAKRTKELMNLLLELRIQVQGEVNGSEKSGGVGKLLDPEIVKRLAGQYATFKDLGQFAKNWLLNPAAQVQKVQNITSQVKDAASKNEKRIRLKNSKINQN